MKIYTKTGDRGDTGLLGGPRVRKDAPRIEAYGTVDELNSCLGLVRCEALPAEVDAILEKVQHELFDLGAELATPNFPDQAMRTRRQGQIAFLEGAIDWAEQELPPLKAFILPAGSRAACLLHLARTVCRRAERRVVHLLDEPGEAVADTAVVYLNRLSDLLFVLARLVNQREGGSDTPWHKPGEEPAADGPGETS